MAYEDQFRSNRTPGSILIDSCMACHRPTNHRCVRTGMNEDVGRILHERYARVEEEIFGSIHPDTWNHMDDTGIVNQIMRNIYRELDADPMNPEAIY